MNAEKAAQSEEPFDRAFDGLALFAESVVHVYCGDGNKTKALLDRNLRVSGVEPDAALAAHARAQLGECVTEDWGARPLPLKEASVDCIVATPRGGSVQATLDILGQVLPTLQPFGLVLIYISAEDLGVNIETRLDVYGLKMYRARSPRSATRYTMIAAHQESEDPMSGDGVVVVRVAYDPIAHAERLLDGGHPDAAFHILDHIPKRMVEDPVTQLIVALNLQLSSLSWAAALAVEEPLHLFYWAQQQFYRVLNLHPQHTGAYLCQAEFWRIIGHEKNALHILRSINHVVPDPAVERRIKTMRGTSFRRGSEVLCHLWEGSFTPRILIINHANADCGIDVLYDGLCRVLGSENISEYPWKHFWHGHALDEDVHHPSSCNHPGEEKSIEQFSGELRSGHYDLILFSDYMHLSNREDIMRLLDANPAIPIVVADAHDEGTDLLPGLLQYMERESVAAYFKREMLQGVRYSDGTYPLPLGYSEGRIPETFPEVRTQDIFWAGHRHFGLRRLYLDHLEERLGRDFNTFYAPDDYSAAMDRSLIGLDFFGLGYDTVRYWELAAHGCMLLAEEKPTVIPHNFVDGQSAVFFRDLPELEERVAYYMSHAGEASDIAAAGHAHFLEHHTASARARQFLGNVQHALNK